MLKLKPVFVKKNGKTEFVILTARDFSAIEKLIEEAGLSRIMKESKKRQAGSPRMSLQHVKHELGITEKPREARA
jgi:PHD/YefM family antitoxin component YafN of YafNO toxin-antitoxin module